MMDLAIRDATLLPCTPGMPVIGGGHVAGEVVASAGPGPGPDAGGEIAMTGMVNPHAHVRMTLFRGPCEEVGDRPFRYVLPMERKFATPEMVRTGTALAARESIRTGASTVADRNSFEAGVGRVLDAAGLRSVVGQTLAAFEPPDPATLDEGYAQVAALAVEFRGHPGIVPPAAPHSTDIPVPRRVADRAYAHPGVPVRVHLAEMDRASRFSWLLSGGGGAPRGSSARRPNRRTLPRSGRGRNLSPDRGGRSRRPWCPAQPRRRHRRPDAWQHA